MEQNLILKNNLKFLKDLVAINSFSQKDEIITFLQNAFKPFSEEIIVLKNKINENKSLIIGLNTKLKNIKPIVLSGHVDTVAPDENLYETNPFVLTIKDNKAFGLGTIDMKSFAAIILENYASLKNFSCPIVIVFTTDEETELLCIENVIEEFKRRNILPKFSVIGEPTNCEINNQANGCLEYHVDVYGKSCHSSLVKNGINSINIMAKIISYIEKTQNKIKGLSSNCGVVEGGDIVNRVPQLCKMKFDVRSANKKLAEKFLRKINKKIKMLEKEYSGAKILLNKKLEIPPLENNQRKIVGQLAKDFNLKISNFSGGCEAGYFQELSGDSIIFGVGDISLAHKPNEFVEISEYRKYSKLLIDILTKISQLV